MALHRTALIVLVAAASFAFTPATNDPKSLIDLSLEKAFPGCEMERVLCRLDETQRKRVGELASQDAFSKGTTFAYIARKADQIIGTGFFDSHVVRTKRETLLIAVNPDGTVQGVDTLVFNEPREYLAQDTFYSSLASRSQGRPLQLGRGLDGTTGATLTCRSVADASRRALALHQVLGAKAGRVPVEKAARSDPADRSR